MTTALDKYIAALKAHDWFYMYADDYRSFTRGKEQWMKLADMRRELDPDHTIFNQYAPAGMQVNTKDANNA